MHEMKIIGTIHGSFFQKDSWNQVISGIITGMNYANYHLGQEGEYVLGISVAEKSLSFMLASLLHSFNWRLAEETNWIY